MNVIHYYVKQSPPAVNSTSFGPASLDVFSLRMQIVIMRTRIPIPANAATRTPRNAAVAQNDAALRRT
jgi:hypothetical protein